MWGAFCCSTRTVDAQQLTTQWATCKPVLLIWMSQLQPCFIASAYKQPGCFFNNLVAEPFETHWIPYVAGQAVPAYIRTLFLLWARRQWCITSTSPGLSLPPVEVHRRAECCNEEWEAPCKHDSAHPLGLEWTGHENQNGSPNSGQVWVVMQRAYQSIRAEDGMGKRVAGATSRMAYTVVRRVFSAFDLWTLLRK